MTTTQAASGEPLPPPPPASLLSTSSSLRLSMASLTTGASTHKSVVSPSWEPRESFKVLGTLLPDGIKASDLASSTTYKVLSGDEPADEACQEIFCGATSLADVSGGDCGIVKLADGKWACLEAADVLALLSLLFQPNISPPHSPCRSSPSPDLSMHSPRPSSSSPAATSIHRERSISSVSSQGGAPLGRVHAPSSSGGPEDGRRSNPIAIPPASPRKRTASISQSSTAFSSSLTRESRRTSQADMQILGLARSAKVVPLRLVAGLAGGRCLALSPKAEAQEVLERIAEGNTVVLADGDGVTEKAKIIDAQSVLRAVLDIADAESSLASLLSTTLEDAGLLHLPLAKSFESEDSVLQAAQLLGSTQATTLVARDGSGSMLCGLSAMRLARALLGAPSKNILHSSLASILPGLLRDDDTSPIQSENSVGSDGSPIPLVPAASTTLLTCAKLLLPTSSSAQAKTLFTRPTSNERLEPSSHGSSKQGKSQTSTTDPIASPLSLQRRPSIPSSPCHLSRTHSRGRSFSSQTSSSETPLSAAPTSASSTLALSLARSQSTSSATSTSPGGLFSTTQKEALARAGLVRRRSSAGFAAMGTTDGDTMLVALRCTEVLALLCLTASHLQGTEN